MPRVLLCDDHPVIRDAIAVCLRAIVPDCEIGVAATARQVLDRLEEPVAWDLVVLDLGLPDARGIDALTRVRVRAPDAKVAVLSATEDRDTVERVLRAGAVAFVPKSTDRIALLEALERLLGIVPAAGDGDPPRPGSRPRDDDLVHEALSGMSARQMQVLRMLVRGLPNKEICRELGLSENTVKIHIGAVLRALGARNRTEAVALVSRVGFGRG
ncbi:MAG: response regulator [Burkholderiales bacterium]|jgi:DNA-binding NarL/FixJ family response regulator